MGAEASKSPSLAERLYNLFVARSDVYGVEDRHGWRTEKGKLTINHIENHLKGEYTLGVYPFNEKGYVKWLLIDIDYKGGDLFYEYLIKKFTKQSVIMEDTGGKGTHVWAFLQPTPIWQIADKIEEMENEIKHRIFPKQRELKPDIIGNFARLPLGRHFKTGNWSKIIKGNLWAVKPYVTCVHRVYDQFGDGNCLAIDGTVGHCQENVCPIILRSERYGR